MVVSEPLAPGPHVRDDQFPELTADSVPLASAGLIPPAPPASCNSVREGMTNVLGGGRAGNAPPIRELVPPLLVNPSMGYAVAWASVLSLEN